MTRVSAGRAALTCSMSPMTKPPPSTRYSGGMAKLKNDLTGQEFGRLTVKARDYSKKAGQARWLCLCDPRLGGCGGLTSVGSESLRMGRTKSCGCWRREFLAQCRTTHGLAPRRGRPRAYSSWYNMIARCTRESWPQFKDWGERGITFDPRWRDFPAFLADMGERPPGMTLERKDNNGPYCRENCVWVTQHQQMMNTRVFKLTPDVVAEIKRLRATGLTMATIGELTNLHPNTVSRALSGKTRQRSPEEKAKEARARKNGKSPRPDAPGARNRITGGGAYG